MSKGFKCARCGWGSLVRSNFRLDHAHVPRCRSEELCEERVRKKAPPQKSSALVEAELRERGLGAFWKY